MTAENQGHARRARLKRVVVVNPANYGRNMAGLRPPFGLLTLVSGLMGLGVEVIWIDADLIRSRQKVFAELRDYLDCDLLMIGGLSTAYKSIKEIISFVESSGSSIKIVVGGRVAKDTGDVVWKFNPRLDMLCRQEGEFVVKDYVEHWPDYKKVRGIEYRMGDDIVVNDVAPTPATFADVPRMRWEILDKSYFAEQGFLLTGRGCPYKCGFCRKKDSLVEKHRSMEFEEILDDIRYLLEKRGVNKITFVDEFFMQNKKRVENLCHAFQTLGVSFSWVCTTRANIIGEGDVPLLRLMKESGCSAINMGLESGSQDMLDKMNKKLRIEQSERAVSAARRAGLKIRPTFIFGFPGETRRTALESVRWRRRWGLKGGFFYATPYPGSDLYDQWLQRDSVDLAKEEAWLLMGPNLNYCNVNLTDMPDWKLRLLGIECALRLNPKRFISKKIQGLKRRLKGS
ncbi:B12-binding domain-containing radical SAM protein [Desulfovibrio ferrophilus]|uniref:Radical SAM domain protein n=1 Tax=Desulfovibrio ferrophilus TaxID=241368 RepID=A0A2Z6B2E6_9BACT|nr:radical SAM protein [Desulfovibrio ferrophilus]BBD09586.1 radical SAM domain protein [Desulfovibrio ferrophilus]